MVNHAVARRYARALFDLAREQNVMDQVDQEFGMVAETVEANPNLKAFLDDVLTSAAVKRNVLTKLLTGKVSDLVLNFLLLVVRKRREAGIPKMYRAYLDLANEARGVVEVEVRSAVPLPEETTRALEQKLVARLGKRIKFETLVAPELIGGLVVRVGDELMDGSVQTRLRRMQERLISAKAD